mgnify:FL=1
MKLGAELQKYMEETDRYRSFTKLSEQIVKVNEELCDLRPVQETEDEKEAGELKKKMQLQFEKKRKKRLRKL